MIRRGTVFDEKDERYVGKLVGWKLVKVVAIIEEPKKVKSKEVYVKKIVEPEKNKEKKAEDKPVTTNQFKRRPYTRSGRYKTKKVY